MKHITNHHAERGEVSGIIVAIIGLSVLVLGLGSFSIWAFVSYSDATSDVDQKIAVKVAEAKKEQADKDEADFTVKENKPTHTFLAPDDYCSLTFDYPKDWSEMWYLKQTNGSDFRAYLNKGFVPPVSTAQQFGLRVTIEQRDIGNVMKRYENLIQTGDLKQTSFSANGKEGTRLTGKFSTYIRGDAVVFRCRDKTIMLQTDTDIFQADFNAIIKTIDFKI